MARGRLFVTRTRCYVFRGTSQLPSTSNKVVCSCKLRLLVCYWTLAISDDTFAHAGTHCNPVLQDNRPLSQAPIKIRKAHSVTGANLSVSEAPAQKLHKSATPTGSVRSAGHRGGQAFVASRRTSHQCRQSCRRRAKAEMQRIRLLALVVGAQGLGVPPS